MRSAGDAYEAAVRSAHRREIIRAAILPGLTLAYLAAHVLAAWLAGRLPL